MTLQKLFKLYFSFYRSSVCILQNWENPLLNFNTLPNASQSLAGIFEGRKHFMLNGAIESSLKTRPHSLNPSTSIIMLRYQSKIISTAIKWGIRAKKFSSLFNKIIYSGSQEHTHELKARKCFLRFPLSCLSPHQDSSFMT